MTEASASVLSCYQLRIYGNNSRFLIGFLPYGFVPYFGPYFFLMRQFFVSVVLLYFPIGSGVEVSAQFFIPRN